ncbi:serine hydrolase [Actinoplanes sp. M2I2]|uniref:serine hydrolase domain-containing protein n=1 Tax=Actinoplanes sp. M2I2 TaxID=1734444 RepID=UPI002021DF96|nr:serine hydrolase domain-containing protein [Actinoplanes sp. M2I2]
MKRPLVACVTTLLTLALVAAPVGPARAVSTNDIDAYLTEAMAATGLPGMSAVVTHRGEVLHTAGLGHDSTGAPITPDTPMRVASVSKSFTAMAVMTLVDAGRIALDEPVSRQLPEFAPADARADRITVRHLLNQTSGLSDRTVDIGAAESAPTLAGYVASLRTGRLAAEPGTRWFYCNANYEVAARLVEVAGGMGFGDYLRQRVLGPLGMTGSAAGDREVRPARGYNSLFGAWVPRRERHMAAGGAGGAGGVVSTAADLGRWLISQTGHGPQLVTSRSLTTMHSPSAVGDYGMGWGPDTVSGAELLVHSGNLFTYNAVEAIDPASGYGFAVLTNGAGLYDETYEILTGLVALTRGQTPAAPGSRRQLIEIALAVVALVAVGLGVLGVLRSRRWAGRRAGRPAWRIGLRLAPVLLPVALFAVYPQLISFLTNGRTVTWAQLTYFAAPLTVAFAAVAVAALATAGMRLIRLRSNIVAPAGTP